MNQGGGFLLKKDFKILVSQRDIYAGHNQYVLYFYDFDGKLCELSNSSNSGAMAK